VTNLSTQERNIAQVFQFPVIYDTMTVYDNLAFPLRNRGVPEPDVDRKVRETLEMTGLADMARRKARGLTADQKQKISLGRGLVRSDVNAILFDEPLTVIDPHMKWVLRSQLKQLHRRFGFTMVYVTHDQTEALTFAENVVVMYEGEIVQIGSPAELFERPKHTFVGYFIGSPGMNVMPVAVEGRSARLGSQTIELPGAPKAGTTGVIELGIRPEYVRLGASGMPVSIRKVEDIGRHKVVRASFEGRDIAAIVGEDEAIPADPKIAFDPAGINIYADSWRVEMGG
jgi:glycerol transport system ATP-binding protein